MKEGWGGEEKNAEREDRGKGGGGEEVGGEARRINFLSTHHLNSPLSAKPCISRDLAINLGKAQSKAGKKSPKKGGEGEGAV